MNIFLLDEDTQRAASYHNDKHVVKMILETAQLLSTAHRVVDGEEEDVYFKTVKRVPINDDPECDEAVATVRLRKRSHSKLVGDEFFNRFGLKIFKKGSYYMKTHVNHPSAVWVRESKSNYEWAYRLFVALCWEYSYRYGKVHKTMKEKGIALGNTPIGIPEKGLTEFPQCMPDECKVEGNPVQAYRNYYKMHKNHIAKWTNREVPTWWEE